MGRHAYLCAGLEEKGIVGTCPVTLRGESVCTRYLWGLQLLETKWPISPVKPLSGSERHKRCWEVNKEREGAKWGRHARDVRWGDESPRAKEARPKARV